MDFPIVTTKSDEYKKFDMTDVESRKAYFEYKAGPEIKKLREYLKENTFVAYLMGKKSSGKGTYSKMFAEVIDKEKIAHFSIGDMIRSFDDVVQDPKKKKELISFLEKEYRGFTPLPELITLMENRSTKKLLPSELILALAKREIAKLGKKAIFIDGFPRDLDQVSYSLFFRDLIDYRNDPDLFILIDVPSEVIDERIKYRVICPLCQTSRNLKLLPTKDIGHDEVTGKFYLLCDNPDCNGVKMVTKEGDELGIAPIKERLEKDAMLIEEAAKLQGIPKIYLRNSVPASKAKEYFDDYELTPEYHYTFNKKENKIEVSEKPWEVKDDEGVASNSLFPPPVIVALIKQLVTILDL